MSTVRIALANLRFPESRDAAVARAVDAILEAGNEEASVVCFPESYLPGYRTPDRAIPAPDAAWLEHAWAAVSDAAARARTTVVMGTERLVNDRLRIATIVVDAQGQRVGFQDKVQLDPSEDASYEPGDERRLFTAGPLTFGVSICHEGWRYPETVRWAARRGAQLVFHPHFHEAEPGSFRPTSFADPRNTFHEKAMLCRAAENGCWFASVNYASEGSPTTSAVVSPDGAVAAWQPYGDDGLLVTDIDLSAATGLLASRCRTY